LPEPQRHLTLPLWPELLQWPGVPGRQEEQADDIPAAPWEWEQPEAEALTTVRRPPDIDRTTPQIKIRIKKRVALVLSMEDILSRWVMKSQGLLEKNI